MSRDSRRQAPRAKPTDVDGLWAFRTRYYEQLLATIIKGRFKVKTPDDWDVDYLLNLLIFEGHFAITKSIAGILPFRNTFAGVNYMNLPTKCLIAVPEMPEMERTINKDCVIIYLQRVYGKGFYTFRDLIKVNAEKLASADACIDVNLMNSRVGYFAEAETKAQADTIKQAYSEITNGTPLVVARTGSTGKSLASDGLHVFFNNVKNSYIADVVQDQKRSIMNEFLTCIGINNANTDKKERLITGEVDSNNAELECNVRAFKKVLKQQMKHVKEIYPELDFSIKLKEFDVSNKGELNATMGNNQSMGVSSPGKKVAR